MGELDSNYEARNNEPDHTTELPLMTLLLPPLSTKIPNGWQQILDTGSNILATVVPRNVVLLQSPSSEQ